MKIEEIEIDKLIPDPSNVRKHDQKYIDAIKICFGMEISPLYVDVIRKRWAEYVHGKDCDWETLTPCI